jgi:hypothetical protein
MSQCAMVVVEGATVQPLHGDTTMIVLGFLVSIAAIGTMCWLLFNLTVFALPFFIGLNTGSWAYGTGAGWLGGIVVGLLAAGLTLAVGQGLLMLLRPLWARLLITLAFVAPAGMAGFYATLGIVKHMMPSETWQLIFSVIGAIAVGVTAFLRVAGMAAAGPADCSLTRA